MDIFDWLTASADVNRHVSPLYFIVVTLITSSVLFYVIKTDNKRALRVFAYGFVVWVVFEFGLFFTGVRQYSVDNPYPYIMLIGGVEDPGWVCLAYIAAERMMKYSKNRDRNLKKEG
jgi:hypothetical protein